MSLTRIARLAVVAAVATLGVTGLHVAPASAAPPRTVYYNADAAGVWKPAVAKAAEIWNANVKNVRLVEGKPATVTLVAAEGWPYAQPQGLGRGRISLGEDAVRIGHDRTRITAHEIGHIFGLPDRRTGLCADLMSGSSAPATCKNATPNAAERAAVDYNFRNGLAGLRAAGTAAYVDCFPLREPTIAA